jgi:hypothetical protein
MAQPELDRLIINNLADLDAAAKHVNDELQPSVSAALDQILETFINQVEWAGAADWSKKLDWLAHNDWRKMGDQIGNDFKCRFVLVEQTAKTAGYDHFWLTMLLGIGCQCAGLRWTRNDVMNLKDWKLALGQQQAAIANLRARGFEYEQAKGSFFLPVRIDQSTLAQAVADESPGLALTPFVDALQICIDAKSDFDTLLAA